jgi:hypothetical protein
MDWPRFTLRESSLRVNREVVHTRWRCYVDETKKNLLKKAGFTKEVAAVSAGACPFCKKPVDQAAFKDELSRKEFRISGICQGCQDGFFK